MVNARFALFFGSLLEGNNQNKLISKTTKTNLHNLEEVEEVVENQC